MKNELMNLNETLNLENYEALPNKFKLRLQNEGGKIMERAFLETLHENGRALLAKTALDNISALAALENHLYKIAPAGYDNYRQIQDAYALGAAKRILRW